MPALGVWEPWEADHVAVVDAMRETGQWLRVQLPEANGGEWRVLPELPYGWWPLAATTTLFGVGELGLRLPALLAAIATLALLFAVVRRFFGRLAGWFAALALLCMPLFTYHARFLLGSGLSMAFIAIAALAFLRVTGDDRASSWWTWTGWLATAAAALVGGLPGLVAPLATLVVAGGTRLFGDDGDHPDDGALLRRVAPLGPLVTCAALVGFGWWRAAAVLPDDRSVAALLLWSDLLDGTLKGSDRPSFDLFVHQIGFGLFPLGALLPFAFAEALWAPRRDDEARAAPWIFAGAAAWFAGAFLAPAISASYSHHAIFLGAPAVAVVVGVYLVRVLRSPPQPLFVLGTVLVLALLDSNLKHETQLLADTLVGERVDAFPAQLPGWPFARLLSMALLGVLLIYQGGVHRFAARFVRAFAYPRAPRPPIDWAIGAITFAVPLGLLFKKSNLAAAVAWPIWGALKEDVRRVIIAGVAWAVAYAIVWGLWYWRARAVAGRDAGKLSRAVEVAARAVERPRVDRYALLAVLALWAIFQNVPIAAALTTNFSQKDILDRYEALADDGEPLYRYRLGTRNSSFYARDLPDLDRKDFLDRANASERFFAIIPRDQLAPINTEFRKAAGRTLPVLDDRGSRFLLVSNQVDAAAGEDDRNPINRALIDALPPGANEVSINFEDKIELVGWQVEPREPSPGSPATLSLFWKALQDDPGTWKVFVHIDAAGQRIHGDHDPVEGLFPTRNWRKGDLVRDDHRVVVKRTISPARFTFFAGLYRGGTRMQIKSGPKDNENRARLGTIEVR
ncbi:MAG: glycosyltransferase family 39 protein [Myxococcales bacterium]|nr:glycosyltransferase family 39 protein [Myxococcales bacterium]